MREQVFDPHRDEIRHATAVVVASFRECLGRPDAVPATLYVERGGQKGIPLGKDARDLRRLTGRARAALAQGFRLPDLRKGGAQRTAIRLECLPMSAHPSY